MIPDWLTPFLAVLCVFAYVIGVASGVVLRAEWQRRRDAEPSRVGPMPTTRVRRTLLYVLAIMALALGFSANILQIHNGHEDHARATCNTIYNEKDGVARDDRDLAARIGSVADLTFWQALRDQIAHPPAAQGPAAQRRARRQFLETIDTKIASIIAIQKTRDRSPYPVPDACSDGSFDGSDLPSPSPFLGPKGRGKR